MVDALLMTVQRPVELELDLGLDGRRLILVTARLVGTDRHRIVAEAECLLHDKGAYRTMAQTGSPFGDGRSAERIVNILLSRL